MVRIRGFEEIATKRGDVCEFITITCPSRFHAYRKAGGRNPKFDPALTPRDAQAYLCNVWAKIRAKLARLDVRLYGFRVAEPNHCGCPHWHMMIFIQESQQAIVRQVIEHYALKDSPNEVFKNKSVRVKFVSIDPAKGTASGYIAKYISKNIDGHAIDYDLYGKDIGDAVERIDAWAACWGIRQFQQIGGPSVGVWRELRRLDSEESGVLEQARAAADCGNWFGFVNAMGGPVVARDDMPVRVAYLQDIDMRTGELPLNKYGELSPGRVVGVRVGVAYHITRFHEWTIKKRNQFDDIAEVKTVSGYIDQRKIAIPEYAGAVDGSQAFKWELLNGRDFPAAWTCVNNCTGVLNDGGRDGKNSKAEKPDKSGKGRTDVPESGFC